MTKEISIRIGQLPLQWNFEIHFFLGDDIEKPKDYEESVDNK